VAGFKARSTRDKGHFELVAEVIMSWTILSEDVFSDLEKNTASWE
jgi:hypothetical protein